MSQYGTEMIQMRDAINATIEAFATEHWKQLLQQYEDEEQEGLMQENSAWIETQYKKYWDAKGQQ